MMKKKILVIIGASRSGSSALEKYIYSKTQVFAGGELRWIFKRGGIDNDLCGCGERAHDCPFWSPYFHQKNLSELDKLRAFFDSPLNVLKLYITPLQTESFKKKRDEYKKAINDLYQYINHNTIVDNSKSPLYFLTIFKLLPKDSYDFSVFFIVRSLKETVFSYKKNKVRVESLLKENMTKKNWIQATIYWYLINMFSLLSTLLTKEKLIISYQEFCSKPWDIDRWLKLNIKSQIIQNSSYHSISGNPSRFTNKEFQIRRDTEFMKQGTYQNFIYEILSAPLILLINTLKFIYYLKIKYQLNKS